MNNSKLLGLSLVVALGACAAEDDGSGDAITNPVPADGSGSPTGDGMNDDGDDDGGPGGNQSDDDGGEEESTSDDPSSMTGASASDDGGDESSGGGEEEGGSPSTGVRGAVIRSVAPAAGQDGIGTLYVGLLVECTADSASAGGSTPIEGADLSADGSSVLYEVTGVPAGTYHLVAFLDDNLNADPSDPYADSADLVTADGFAPGCVTVTIVDGEIATAPAPVNLNLVYPL